MCYGFSTIVLGNGEGFHVYFTAPDRNGNISHSTIMRAIEKHHLGTFSDVSPVFRKFVRTENTHWDRVSFHFDEFSALPSWAEEHRFVIEEAVNRLMERVKPIMLEHRKAQREILQKFHDDHPGKLLLQPFWMKGDTEASAQDKREYKNQTAILRDQYIDKLSRIPGFVPTTR